MLKHGNAARVWRSPTYISWANMRARCNNPNHHRYKSYGGRGIKVCKRWNDFKKFFIDMGPRPEGMTLDRMDVNKNYCKANCRWATDAEQRANKRVSSKTVSKRCNASTA